MGFFERLWEDPGPDRGWSWVVAVATCWITFFTYGVSRAAGVLFVAMVETFGVARREASWPFTLAPATGCILTVVAGILFRYLSTRQTVFIGGTLCAIGIGLCFFATSIHWFVVCFGVVYGLGLSLSVPLLVSILNEYFIKHRATANGIYLSGSTLGCFFMPPLLGHLVDTYGLRGTMLIQSAFVLHIFIGALLLRPRSVTHFPRLREQENGMAKKSSLETLPAEDEAITKNLLVDEDNNAELKMNDETGSYEVILPDSVRKDSYVSFKTKDIQDRTRKDSYVSIKTSKTDNTRKDSYVSIKTRGSIRSRIVGNMAADAPLTASQTNLNMIGGSVTMLDTIGTMAKSEPPPTMGYFKTLLEIICDPFFYMVVLSSASCFIPLFTFMMVIMDFGIDRGMSKEKAVLLMSAISVPELMGRLCFGWVSDKGYVKYKTLFMIAKALAAVLMFSLPQVTNDAELFVVAGVYGAVESCSIILLNVLFVEYLGLKKLSIAFSWSIFLNGFIFIAMPHMIAIVSGALINFFTIRQTVIIGGVICTFGIGFCSFAQNMNWFVIGYGIIYGFGLSLCVPLLITILNEYFVKHRATANGIFLSGSTLGCFFMSPLLGYLLDQYGLSGTMLILSAFSLHILIGALLLRPRHQTQFPVLKLFDISMVNEVELLPTRKTTTGDQIEQENSECTNDKLTYSDVLIDTLLRNDNNTDDIVKSTSPNAKRIPALQDRKDSTTEYTDNLTKADSGIRKGYSGLFVEIFSDPFFYILAFSSVSCTLPLFTFTMVLMDFGIDRGMSKDVAVLLISAISVPELIGRVCFGWISDKNYLKNKTFFIIVKVCAAVLLFLLTRVSSHLNVFLVAGAYGAVESCSAVLLNILFVEYLGPEKIAIAFSWSAFANGFVIICMPQLIGLFRDILGKYDYLFHVMGALCVAAALSWGPEPILQKRRHAK